MAKRYFKYRNLTILETIQVDCAMLVHLVVETNHPLCIQLVLLLLGQVLKHQSDQFEFIVLRVRLLNILEMLLSSGLLN